MPRTLTTLILAVVCACIPPAHDIEPDRGGSSADGIEQRQQRIATELATLGEHPWAGSYFRGDGFDQNRRLLLSPGAGFVFRWFGCTGEYDRNCGSVQATDCTLHLECALPNGEGEHRGCPEVLVPVRWGERRYLIAPDEFVGFCDSINSGFEPRDSMLGGVLLREGDWKREARGQPELPPEYQRYLLAQPLETTIVAVGESTLEELGPVHLRHTRVTLGAGRAHGAFVGMTFRVGPQELTASVLEVSEGTSEARVDTYDDPTPVLPEPGWRCSTRR